MLISHPWVHTIHPFTLPKVRSLMLHLSAKLGGEEALKQLVQQNAPQRVSTQLESVLQV